MLITRLELENIKSYRHAVVDFRHGTTAISGANGAGKTTLVEAIGFALFDYMPYNASRFVREGEKFGRVIVQLIGNDDRLYTVERRCGSGSRWFIYDEEANFRVAEQSADVLDNLHDLFGIDRERPLASLFRDALGVPQGTFTAIFLDPPSKRKQTFDALLQIEDYKTAADYLLEAQKQYKEQMQTQQGEIQRLTYETRDLDSWRIELKEARQLDEQQKAQNAQWTEQLTQYEARASVLAEQSRQVEQLLQDYQRCQKDYEYNQALLVEREQRLQDARTAYQIVTASTEDFQRHLQASEALKRLRRDEQQRNALRQKMGELQKVEATTLANMKNLQSRLEEIVVARQRLAELEPFVEQQVRMERERDELICKVARYQAVVAEEKRLNKQLATYNEKLVGVQQRIAEIEPLKPLADLFPARSEAWTQLKIQSSEHASREKQLQEKREQLREKQMEREQTAENLRKAERNVALIEEHRPEAEEMPVLQEQKMQLLAQVNWLQGNIEGYTKSREQSAGGQCPLLHETCLNIKQRGLLSLEFYFDGLLQEEHAQLARARQQQDTVTERMAAIKKYSDALNNLGKYIERRDAVAENMQRIDSELRRLEREIADLLQALDLLKDVDRQMSEAEKALNESKNADTKVRELTGLYKQVQQLQEQVRQYEADIRERQQEARELQGSEALLKQVKANLDKLNDPRSRSKTEQATIAKEGHFQQQLQKEQQRYQETQEQLANLSEQLAMYNTLDSDIANQDAIQQHSQNGYQNYLNHQKEAQLLPEREQAYQQQGSVTAQAERTLHEVEHTYLEANAAFDRGELDTLNAAITQLRTDLATLAQKMQHHQASINRLEQQIERAETLRLELEAAQKEYQTLEDLHTMMGQFRGLIKEAAPHVLKAMLADISAEANRIFGEIMGDRSAQLSWQNDYEILLRRQGVNRSFAQLSGGEQMSAALAVRLALLKKLSTLSIAFFDEPTQNMDELRRMNLADQIRRVRGFDQLIVISHDDTFEQGLDSLIRLNKVDGETHIVGQGSIEQGEFSVGQAPTIDDFATA
jgi:exonuclease SbcC